MKPVYLDHTATTPLAPEVLEAMKPYFGESFGNASSIHSFGRQAKLALEESRETIAKSIGAGFDELFFTSGGTEADNHALRGVVEGGRKSGKNHLIVSAIEHHAILHPAKRLREEGVEVTIVAVDELGMVNPDEIRRAITPRTCLISVMHANNEVGTIEPIAAIGAMGREHGIIVHSDAVQTLGKIPVNADGLNVDLLSFSAHKLYGPKGIGAIYIRKGTKIDPFLEGGAQESNRRAGTENVPSAVGFAKAVELCGKYPEESERLKALGKRLRQRISSELSGVIFNGHPMEALPNIVSISFDSKRRNVDGEALIIGMDLRGVAVTSGSACTSGSLQPSHVLLAMGRDEATARATIRFSMGRSTTEGDIDYAVDALMDVLAKMNKN
ncbi:MAG: cysteine desulfurase family protein [Bacteroidota bacterium]